MQLQISASEPRALTIMGDDTVTGRRLMEMIQPEACMDKPEAVDCAAVEAEGLGRRLHHP